MNSKVSSASPEDAEHDKHRGECKEDTGASWSSRDATLRSTRSHPLPNVREATPCYVREATHCLEHDFCHLKHSELAAHLQMTKGTIVIQGNNVKDDIGLKEVFFEHGTSASQEIRGKSLGHNMAMEWPTEWMQLPS